MESWILEIGVTGYVIDKHVIILGELQKSHWINAIILNTKKFIFNAKIFLSIPNIESLKKYKIV